MINEKEGEVDFLSQQFDARVVHTVRNLKKNPSKSDDNKSSGDSDNSITRSNQNNQNKEEVGFNRQKCDETAIPKISQNIQNIFSNKIEKREKRLIESNLNSEVEKSRENIIKSKNNISERKNSNKETINKMRISIDGSGQSTSDSTKQNLLSDNKPGRNTISNKDTTKFKLKKETTLKSSSNLTSFKLAQSGSVSLTGNSSFAPMRTKSEFQKRLMSENNIIKYKSMCVYLLKDDEELKKMGEFCGIIPITTTGIFTNPTSALENFLEEFFFNDKYFLYKLESLLTSDVSKQKKEKFFKDEIKKYFEIKVLDIQYESKIKRLNLAIDNHIQNIEFFEFFN